MRLTLLLIVALLMALSAGAWPCPYSIRDAGFIVRDPLPYRLVVPAQRLTAAQAAATRAAHDRLSAQVLDEANVRVELLDLQREPRHPLRAKLTAAGLKPGETALVAPDERVMAAPQSSASSQEAVLQDQLRRTTSSRLREDLVPRLISSWCVVLLVEGAEPRDVEAANRAIAAAAEAMVGFKPETGDPVRAAPPIARVRYDDPAERVLRWSLRLDEGDLRQTRAAVIFGRGRRAGPVLRGSQITEGRLLELFRLLGKNCACTSDPSWLLGPALPLNWGETLRKQVREHLGFDPDNPNVAATLSGVWKTFRARDAALVPGETVPEPSTGYMEFNVQQEATPPPARDPEAGETPDEDQGAALEGEAWRGGLCAGVGLAAAALGGTAAVIWLSRRHA